MTTYVANKDFGKLKKDQEFDEKDMTDSAARALVQMGVARQKEEPPKEEAVRRGPGRPRKQEYDTRDMTAKGREETK